MQRFPLESEALSAVRTISILVVATALLLTIPGVFASPAPPVPPPVLSPGVPFALGHSNPTASPDTPSISPIAPTPVESPAGPGRSPLPLAATSSNVSYYRNTSLENSSSPYCLFGSYCYPQSASPTALKLADGDIGVAYAVTTDITNAPVTCPNFNNTTSESLTEFRVGFAISADNGTTFGPLRLIGNASCQYLNDFEPSFAVGPSGTIVGTYVQANATPVTLNGNAAFYVDAPLLNYSVRSDDSLALIQSADNGTTWSNSSTIRVPGATDNIARPALAVHGSTIYIVYENVSNSTLGATIATSQGWTSAPISVQLIYSTDGGANWKGPYTLPGLNATSDYSAMSPSIAVNSSGEVAVAYATDHHCIAYCSSVSLSIGMGVYGSDIYVATSTTNGSSWSMHRVAQNQGNGEAVGYQGLSFYSWAQPGELFQSSPSTSIAFDPSGNRVYVAWAGASNASVNCSASTYSPPYPGYVCGSQDWTSSQVYAAVSSSAASNWTNATVSPSLSGAANTVFQTAYNPAIAVSPSGEVTLTFSYLYYAYAAGECGPGNRGAFTPGLSQWIAQSPDGVHWGDRSIANYLSVSYNGATYLGWTSSIAYTTAGTPVVAYPVNLGEQWNFNFGYDNSSSTIQVATAWDQGYSTLTIDESGLPVGTTWTVNVQGADFSTSAASLSVNVPKGGPFSLFSDPVPWGYRTLKVPFGNSHPLYAGQNIFLVTTNTTLALNFTTFYGVSFDVDPHDQPTFAVEFYSAALGLTYGSFWNVYGSSYSVFGCPFPWYLPAGSTLTGSHVPYPYDTPGLSWTDYGTGPGVHFFNGTGPGSYTGGGSTLNLTVSSPFNETFWEETYGLYSVAVHANGIPSASTFHFEWDGASYASNGTFTVILPKVPTGIHWVSNITASGATVGWEYIGTAASGGEVAVPDEPGVNLTFAYVDVAGPLGTVSFRAQNLTPGTVWRLELNGTEYSSSTAWINITTRSGTYSEASFPAVSANGTASYVVSGLPPTVNVTVGGTYSVDFTPADELQVIASSGGSISPAASAYWVAPGTVENLTALPRTGYRFVGWAGTGPGSFTGTNLTAMVTVDGPVVESANFEPLIANRFNLTISDGQSLPKGTWWSAFIDGRGYSSNGTSITIPNVYSCTFSGNLGTYTVRVEYAYANSSELTRYVPVLYPPTACGGTTVLVTFAPQYFLTVRSSPGGTAVASVGGAQSSVGIWLGPNDLASILATADTGYEFIGWNGTGAGSYNGTADPQSVALSGPVTEVAEFAPIFVPPPVVFWLSFHLAAPLPSGTIWTVSVGPTTYSSSSSDYLNVTGLSGGQNYSVHVFTAYSEDRLSQFTPVKPPTEISLDANRTVELAYQTAYWVSIGSNGQGTASPSSGWVVAGGSITLVANASSPYVFDGWSGNGTGSYTGPEATHTLTVTAPIREVATFGTFPPAAGQIVSVWGSPYLWAGLILVAAAIGLTAGVLFARYRRRATGAEGGEP